MKRFWDKVDKSGDCWEWTASASRGYGYFRFEGRDQPAHRVSWVLANGKIPDGLHVCHHCDNRVCVRPDHLFTGTQFDNMRDAAAKGRLSDRPQSKFRTWSKLTNGQVVLIRKSDQPSRSLGKLYGVSKTTILNVKSGKIFNDV